MDQLTISGKKGEKEQIFTSQETTWMEKSSSKSKNWQIMSAVGERKGSLQGANN